MGDGPLGELLTLFLVIDIGYFIITSIIANHSPLYRAMRNVAWVRFTRRITRLVFGVAILVALLSIVAHYLGLADLSTINDQSRGFLYGYSC